MNWIKTSDNLPPIDPVAEQETLIAGTSAKCLVILERDPNEVQFGRYNHAAGRWWIEGTNTNYEVSHWCEITPPGYQHEDPRPGLVHNQQWCAADGGIVYNNEDDRFMVGLYTDNGSCISLPPDMTEKIAAVLNGTMIESPNRSTPPGEVNDVQALIAYVKEHAFDGVDYEVGVTYQTREMKELVRRAEA